MAPRGPGIVYAPDYPLLTIRGEMTIFEVFSILGLIIAVVSFIIAARSAVEQTQTRAADFSFRVWERFRSEDIQKAFLMIEWGDFHYPHPTRTGFENDEEERRIDRLLSLLDDVVGLAKKNILSKSDIERWEYIGVRVFQDDSVRNYMVFLRAFYASNAIVSGPHMHAEAFFKRDVNWTPFHKRENGDPKI